jgi:hypothetical protein
VSSAPHTVPDGFASPTTSGAEFSHTKGKTFDVGVGDIVILPPGTVHPLDVDPAGDAVYHPGIDPEHRQKAGFVRRC